MWAVVAKQFDAFQAMLDQGANPNFRFDPPASEKIDSLMSVLTVLSDSRFLEAALARGGDPNTLRHPDFYGQTILFQAVWDGVPENVSLLARAGADLDHRDGNGKTASHTAIDTLRWSHLVVLFKAGANINIPNKWNFTTLDILKEFGDRGLNSEDKEAFMEFVALVRGEGFLESSSDPRFDGDPATTPTTTNDQQ